MTIKQKILGKSLGSALLLAAVGMMSALSMLRIGDSLRTDIAVELKETRESDELQEAAVKITHDTLNYINAVRDGRLADGSRLKAEIDGAFDQIDRATSRLDQIIIPLPDEPSESRPGDDSYERHQLYLVEQQARLSKNDWSLLQAQLKSNNDKKADSAVLEQMTLGIDALSKHTGKLERETKDQMARAVEDGERRVATSVRFLIVAAVIAVLLSLIVASLVAMPLAARLGKLRDVAEKIGQGNFETRIGVDSGGDEIGQLGIAFNEMAAGLHRSHNEIRESESKFRELAESIHEVFWITNIDCSKLLYVSPAYEEIWGRSRESAYEDGRSFAAAIVPEDRPRVVAALETMATKGYHEDYRIARPDGTIRWIRGRGFAVRDETGRVLRIVGIASDATEQCIAEQALRNAHAELESRVEARTAELMQANQALKQTEIDLQRAKEIAETTSRSLSVVFDTALDAIITIDSQSIVTAWNLQAKTMFRWDRTEAVGMRLDQTIVSEPQWDAHRREIEGFLKTGEGPLLNKVAELVAIRRGGQEFPVEIAIIPACSNGQWTFTAFIRDITLRKQTEAALRQAKETAESASRAKSEFLANMSHEIRTPLNGVIGMSDLLMDTALDERQRRFAELIKSSGASLADLINDILDFSKIEARKLEIESVDFDLHAVLEDVSEMMLMKASQKGLDLACVTMPDVPRQVKGDSQRVKQILINLINNAIKFTESGSISARLTLEGQSHYYMIVRFSVTDTGAGIRADRMDRLFKSFSQVDASTTRSYGGTGLGLAISKQLAELMGGSIGVESTVGCGSTFWFTVRLGVGSPVHEPGSDVAINFTGLRVLTVHHDPIMGEILSSQLCSWRMEVATAPTSDEAMKMLVDAAANSRPFDVAILDNDLPATNTLEVGKAIKARPEIAPTILLILLSMDSNLEPSKLTAAGFLGHLIKPVRQSRLYDSIVTAIASKPRAKRVAAEAPTSANNPGNHPMQAPQKARILIAEDNRVNQIVVSELLAKHGYAYDIVGDGKKAVAAVSTGCYDLVLMDCLMPEQDGFEATMQIRRDEQADPARRRRRTPIIALTANAINGDRERCLQAGMDDYVSKPLNPNRLIEAIQTLLARPDKSSPTLPVTGPLALSVTTPPEIVRDETPPISIDALLDRCMGNIETVTLILDEFERQAVANLAEIRHCVGSGDCAGLSRVAHALKGASGVLSAEAVAEIAFKLERIGRAGVLAGENQLLEQLDEQVRRCVNYLPTARAAIASKVKV